MKRMTGIDTADTAVAVMCWDNGGQRLVGLMVVRRAVVMHALSRCRRL
jgi:hypothetical protein